MQLNIGLADYVTTINREQISFQYKFNPGSDEVVVFIHGLACSRDSFRNVFDADYFPNKSLLLVDLVGFGKSSKSPDFSYAMEDQAKLLGELLLLPSVKIHLVAHSMGGAVALLLPANILSHVLSFTNIEGNLVASDCGILSRGIISVPFEVYRDRMFGKQMAMLADHAQFRFHETDPLAVYKSAASLVQWSDSGELLRIFKSLGMRRSYFYGEENKAIPVLDCLDFVEKHMIPQSGHGVMTDNPKDFYTKLAGFIDPQ